MPGTATPGLCLGAPWALGEVRVCTRFARPRQASLQPAEAIGDQEAVQELGRGHSRFADLQTPPGHLRPAK